MKILKKSESHINEESLNINKQLSEIHEDIKKVMAYSKKLRFDDIIKISVQEYSEVLRKHILEHIESGLEQKIALKCPANKKCTYLIIDFLQDNAELILRNQSDNFLISKKRN
jgi:hypothetical protein